MRRWWRRSSSATSIYHHILSHSYNRNRQEFLPTRRPQTHWMTLSMLSFNLLEHYGIGVYTMRKFSLQPLSSETNTPKQPDILTHFCQSWNAVTEWILRVHPTHLVVLRTQTGSLSEVEHKIEERWTDRQTHIIISQAKSNSQTQPPRLYIYGESCIL